MRKGVRSRPGAWGFWTESPAPPHTPRTRDRQSRSEKTAPTGCLCAPSELVRSPSWRHTHILETWGFGVAWQVMAKKRTPDVPHPRLR